MSYSNYIASGPFVISLIMYWPKSIKKAREIQSSIRNKIIIKPLSREPKIIAGADAAFIGNTVIAAVCVYTYPELELLDSTYAIRKTPFPYIPGYLSFREGPALIKALKNLKIKPDIALFDGQGIAHPLSTGIASHMGVLLNIPAIGCAKSRLIGDYKEPGSKKGQRSSLKYHGKTIGAALRTRENVKPVFVSPGHLINLKKAIEIVIKCTGKYRIPEPLRQADILSKKIKPGNLGFKGIYSLN